ncbi:MAG: hypothetical protein KatS3mg031_0180 [Chitinophagales bacterium]|nr:MAG: hypothetical protein KatS3mg031_0180 [Chitinophagales bacterium]
MEPNEKKTKLTLYVRARTVSRARQAARKYKTSISALVDAYMESLEAAEKQGRLHPVIARLSGVIEARVKADEIGMPRRK